MHGLRSSGSFLIFYFSVKKSVIQEDLQAHALGLWGLLLAFCRYPIDTCERFRYFTKHLNSFLKKNSLMHESIAISLQVFPMCFPSNYFIHSYDYSPLSFFPLGSLDAYKCVVLVPVLFFFFFSYKCIFSVFCRNL